MRLVCGAAGLTAFKPLAAPLRGLEPSSTGKACCSASEGAQAGAAGGRAAPGGGAAGKTGGAGAAAAEVAAAAGAADATCPHSYPVMLPEAPQVCWLGWGEAESAFARGMWHVHEAPHEPNQTMCGPAVWCLQSAPGSWQLLPQQDVAMVDVTASVQMAMLQVRMPGMCIIALSAAASIPTAAGGGAMMQWPGVPALHPHSNGWRCNDAMARRA
jgi:hypothetical protein